MADIADLVMKVRADTQPAQDNLAKLNDSASKSGGFFKNAASSLAGFVGGAAVVGTVSTAFDFLKDKIKESIDAASADQNIQAQLGAALKSTGGASGETAAGLNDIAEKLSLTTTFSKDTTLAAETLALRFTNIGQSVFPGVITQAQNLSARMGIDLNSAIKLVGKATDDPIKGMTALTRVGVEFDQKTKDNIKTLVAHGETAKAQGIILDALSTKFGGAAQAAGGTLAGKLQILQNAFEEVKVKIGNAVIPILGQLLTIAQPVINALGDALPGAMSIVSGAIKFVSDGITGLIGFLTKLQKPITDVFQGFQYFGSVMLSIITSAIKPLLDSFGGLSKGISPVGDVLKIVSDALENFSAIFVGDAEGWGTGQTFLDGFQATLKQLVPIVGTVLKAAFDNLKTSFQIFMGILQAVLPLVGTLWDAFQKILPAVLAVGNAFIQAVLPIIKNIAAEIQNEFIPALKYIVPIIQPIIAKVAEWVVQLSTILIPIIQLVGNILSVVLPWAIGVVIRSFEVILGVVQFIWPTISAVISTVINTIQAIVKTFSDLFKGNWGKLWGDVLGIFTAWYGGLINILKAVIGSVLGLFGGLLGGILGVLGGLLGGLLGFFGKVFGGLLGAIGNGIGGVIYQFTTVPGKILGALGSLWGSLNQLGNNILQGMAQGIISGISSVLNALGQLKDKAIAALGDIGKNIKNTVNNIPGLGGIAGAFGFAEGTDSAPGGLSMVGEGGEPEVVVGPHVVNLPRGAGVYPLSKLPAANSGGSSGPRTQTIIMMLDGDILTRTVVKNTPKEVWLGTGIRG